ADPTAEGRGQLGRDHRAEGARPPDVQLVEVREVVDPGDDEVAPIGARKATAQIPSDDRERALARLGREGRLPDGVRDHEADALHADRLVTARCGEAVARPPPDLE